MRAVVIYESMFGNTRRVAEVVSETLGESMEVRLLRADAAEELDVGAVDLLVVGAPTHAWGLPRAATRQGALNTMRQSGSARVLEPGASAGPGVREWLDALGTPQVAGAAFDTRFRGPSRLTGSAARSIARELTRRGVTLIAPTASFFVDRRHVLRTGEVERAALWARRLGVDVAARHGAAS